MFNNNLRIFDVPNILYSAITSNNHIGSNDSLYYCKNSKTYLPNYDFVDAAFLSEINRQGIE